MKTIAIKASQELIDKLGGLHKRLTVAYGSDWKAEDTKTYALATGIEHCLEGLEDLEESQS